jgi:hypothetical protein
LTRDVDTGETVVKGGKTDAVVTNVAMNTRSCGLQQTVSGMISFFMISAQ